MALLAPATHARIYNASATKGLSRGGAGIFSRTCTADFPHHHRTLDCIRTNGKSHERWPIACLYRRAIFCLLDESPIWYIYLYYFETYFKYFYLRGKKKSLEFTIFIRFKYFVLISLKRNLFSFFFFFFTNWESTTWSNFDDFSLIRVMCITHASNAAGTRQKVKVYTFLKVMRFLIMQS